MGEEGLLGLVELVLGLEEEEVVGCGDDDEAEGYFTYESFHTCIIYFLA